MITIDFVADLLKGQAGHLACYVNNNVAGIGNVHMLLFRANIGGG